MFVGVATTALADRLALPTLGTSPLLAGEAKAVQRGKKIALKPDANVRLLQRAHIVGSVTTHERVVALLLERTQNCLLVFG